MKHIFTILTVILLVSCTESPLESESYDIPLLQDQQEPCTPSFIAQDEYQNLFVCSSDSVWKPVAQEPDTIWRMETDTITNTITDIRNDTLIFHDTIYTFLARCGNRNYDTTHQFCDHRDSMIYEWVRIGNKVWMAQNLNYGDTVMTPQSLPFFGQKYCYQNNLKNCKEDGGLYPWRAAIDTNSFVEGQETIRGACPYDWHLPDSSEWADFADVIERMGGIKTAKSTEGWTDSTPDELKGTNESGFNAHASGRWDGSLTRPWNSKGEGTAWWVAHKSASQNVFLFASDTSISFNYNTLSRRVESYSIRCVRDY